MEVVPAEEEVKQEGEGDALCPGPEVPAEPALGTRQHLAEVYLNCINAMGMIRNAGKPQYEDSPMKAIQELKDCEEHLHSEIPEHVLPRTPRTITDTYRSTVESRVRAEMINEPYENELANRPKAPVSAEHPAAKILSADRPSRRSRSQSSGRWAKIESRYSVLREGVLPECCRTPEINRRTEVRNLQEQAAAQRWTTRSRSCAAGGVGNSSGASRSFGADMVAFPPRVYHLAEQTIAHQAGKAKRREMDELHAKWKATRPRAVAPPEIPQPERPPSRYVPLRTNPEEPFFTPALDNPRMQVRLRRQEAVDKCVKPRSAPEPPAMPVPLRAPMKVPADFVPRVWNLVPVAGPNNPRNEVRSRVQRCMGPIALEEAARRARSSSRGSSSRGDRSTAAISDHHSCASTGRSSTTSPAPADQLQAYLAPGASLESNAAPEQFFAEGQMPSAENAPLQEYLPENPEMSAPQNEEMFDLSDERGNPEELLPHL